MKTALILTITSLILFLSCKKKEEASLRNPKLTAGPWYSQKNQIWKIKGGDTLKEVNNDIMDSCFWDNTMQFYDDGTYFLDRGLNSCGSTREDHGTWKLFEWNKLRTKSEAYPQSWVEVIIRLDDSLLITTYEGYDKENFAVIIRTR